MDEVNTRESWVVVETLAAIVSSDAVCAMLWFIELFCDEDDAVTIRSKYGVYEERAMKRDGNND
jgi:hypothetical protein